MFTKELPNQVSVDIALWDIILKAEECDNVLPKEDLEKIKHLLSFFRQALMSSKTYKTPEVLNKLIDTLLSISDSCSSELAFNLLTATREYEDLV